MGVADAGFWWMTVIGAAIWITMMLAALRYL